MNEQPIQQSDFVTLRDLVQPLVRYRAVALLTFLGLFAAAVWAVAVMKPEFEATMKLLVRRERMDPVMTASASDPGRDRVEVTEDELNSEVELLKSRDLLQRVALSSGMVDSSEPTDPVAPPSSSTSTRTASSIGLSRAVNALQQGLQIEAVRKSTLIQIRYRSTNPEQAAGVLSNLASFYIAQHLSFQRPRGAYQFFQAQTRTFSDKLAQAESRLAEFGRSQRVASPTTERDSTLQALAEFEAGLLRARTQMAETDQRLSTLRAQMSTTPSRQTTQIHTASDNERVRDLKSKLFDLERRRADMQRFYNPEHPPLAQLADQILQARTALADAERTSVTAETSDQNPTHQWLRDEVARATTERDGLAARVGALARSVEQYREKALRLDEVRAREDEIARDVKTARDNFELYQRKQEEARMSDALDRTGVADVMLAEAPVVPTLPSNTRRLGLLALGFVLASVAGVVAALVCHYANPYFRADAEVQSYLGVPVLATLPHEARVTS